MIALGIDPGTALCGYGIVRAVGDDYELVACGAIATPAKTPLEFRLLKIYDELGAIIRAYKPNTAAVEKLFFSRNTTTALSVGHARGVILLALAQACLPLAEYTPNEIKQAVAGYGGADKYQMQQMVRVLLRLDQAPKPDDAADAVAIALCHLQSARLRELIDSQS
ncbi:MAG: crossover junction endodeoxyribonuclease RuvC [Chloroflexi bacterium UTCFX4]|jgi:crossover junction endodeoxyribonuclease RuvC|nr:MAG: crossover junction endodeoxyribonuclease RuvC [Chloroflexi bacterium UTCFX4]